MAHGILLRNQNGITQIDQDFKNVNGGPVYTSNAVYLNGFLGAGYFIQVAFNLYPTRSILLLRNTTTTTPITDLSGLNYYDPLQPFSTCQVVVGGAFKYFIAQPESWIPETSGYGIIVRDPTGAIAFSSNQVNFRFTTTISEPLTTSFVSKTVDYPISKGGYTGDLYYTQALSSWAEVAVTPYITFAVTYWAYLLNDSTLRVIYTRQPNSTYAVPHGAPSTTTMTHLVGVRT